MSLPALSYSQDGEFGKSSDKKSIELHSNNARHSIKKNTKKKSESELRAAKEKEERLLQLYDLWLQVKDEEKELKNQYYKERVAIQHQLIEKQDVLWKKHQEKIDARERKLKESSRLSKLAQSKHYTDFVKDALAKERVQKSSLKSHTRVLSSHQPARIPILISNSPYKSVDMNDGRSLSGSSVTNGAGESILLSDDFSELMNESVEVQLHTLLGPSALNFLKPTFRDGAKKSLDPLIEKYKTGGIGARQLWSMLRGKSQKKLEKEDERIPQDLKNSYRSFLRECLHSDVPVIERSFCNNPDEIPEEKLNESLLIKDINFARHRLDLMYRVAHMNKDKTRLLFNNMESADPKEGSVRPSRYDPNQIKNPKVTLAALPPSLPRIPENSDSTKSPREEKEPVVVGGEKIVFLTEAMATVKGEFSKRHNAAGSKNDDTSQDSKNTASKNTKFRSVVSAPISSQGERVHKQSQVKLWQPLSLDALLEYTTPVNLGGHGEFLQGQNRKWKVDTDIPHS